MPDMTPQQESQLIGFLSEITKQWQEMQKTHKLLLENASLHICPDQSWISVEHEFGIDIANIAKAEGDIATALRNPSQGVLIRKSPACHQIIVKI